MTASTPQPARASVWSVALAGVDGQRIEIRAQLQDADDPARHAWQLDDTREVRERVRAAVRNSDLPWPARPVTLTTFPVAPPSGLAGCDLAWACAVLAADGTVAADRLEHTVLLGELALDGRLRPVRGVLSALLVARRAGLRQAIVPAAALPEAALVPDIPVLGADSLSDVVAWLRGEDASLTPPSQAITVPEPGGADLADVIGQPEAASGLEVAAAGGHHLLLIGPPGTGKSMLAQRLPGLLPPLSHEQALEVTAVHSIAGLLTPESPLITTPPFVAPHHSASFPALLGGGNGLARPGAISMAHHGVLFLDFSDHLMGCS